MSLRCRLGLLLVVLLLSAASCAKLPEARSRAEGDVAIERLPTVDAIPAEWGDLVAVSNSANAGHMFQMWFQDDEGNLHVAFYNVRSNEIQSEGRLFPRSQGVTR